MSCKWFIRCVTCNPHGTSYDDRDHWFQEANHRDDLMRELITHAPTFAAMAPMMVALAETPVSIEFSIPPYGRIDPAWFAKHLGHKLQPVDEYNRLDDQCEGWASCEAGHNHPCKLKLDHPGDHSIKPTEVAP